jgi:hypothetical protein
MVIRFITTDGPKPVPQGRSTATIDVTRREEIDQVLDALKASDHDADAGEPVGMGKDNQMEISFRGVEKSYMTVSASEIDRKWGKYVRGVFDRYLPRDMYLLRGQIVSKPQ